MKGSIVQRFIEWVILHGGLYVLLLIEFAETGLFLGFFLPGDSLLFAAGIYINDLAKAFFNLPYVLIIALVILATTLGSFTGYWFGYKTGPYLFKREDTFLFKKKHLLRAKEFYDKHGKSTVLLSKFLPIIRTFAPIVAGITKMPLKTFAFYNISGSIAWASIMMLSGHFLQSVILKKYNFSLKDHIEIITILIVLVTTLPILYKVFFPAKPNAVISKERV